MNPQAVLAIIADYLPVVLTVLAALGLWEIARNGIRYLKDLVKGSPSKLDDAIALPVLDGLEKLIDDVAAGRMHPGIAQAAARDLVKRMK